MPPTSPIDWVRIFRNGRFHLSFLQTYAAGRRLFFQLIAAIKQLALRFILGAYRLRMSESRTITGANNHSPETENSNTVQDYNAFRADSEALPQVGLGGAYNSEPSTIALGFSDVSSAPFPSPAELGNTSPSTFTQDNSALPNAAHHRRPNIATLITLPGRSISAAHSPHGVLFSPLSAVADNFFPMAPTEHGRYSLSQTV